MTEHDGSFRRLMEMVKEQQSVPLSGKPGRPAKNRVSTTGHFAVRIHDLMKAMAKERTSQTDHMVSTADLYNEAAICLITDLHELLGEELKLPAGATSLAGILGLRELIARPVRTPLREFGLQGEDLQRTTIYIDQPVWDALMEMSLRFGLRMRRTIYVQRLLELAAAWFLAGFEFESEQK